jgi:erythromycin esterase-like protein
MAGRLAKLSVPLTGAASDFDALLERIGSRRFVLIGEASHGTHEFYDVRARVTRRLIAERGFHAVAVEADWPDAYRVNRYVHGRGSDRTADDALSGFERFPRWMWRNTAVRDFAEWLRGHNASAGFAAGFYGVDLYSLGASRDAVVEYLDKVDPAAARRARERYACFDHHGDPETYGYNASLGLTSTCEQEAVQQMIDLRTRAWEYMSRDGFVAEDEYFAAEQNARLVQNAEEYYRSMFQPRTSSWNLRDRHMADTIHALAEHLRRRFGSPRIVVWEHNSHLGDARATQMFRRGEWNVGQLIRESYGDDAVLIGFTTYTGEVMAADDWAGEGEVKKVRTALPGSYEDVLHQQLGGDAYLILQNEAADILRTPRLERAIGVIYRPETERWSHYFEARLPEQFDVIIHLDRTHAVDPLERKPLSHPEEVPETYPAGV